MSKHTDHGYTNQPNPNFGKLVSDPDQVNTAIAASDGSS